MSNYEKGDRVIVRKVECPAWMGHMVDKEYEIGRPSLSGSGAKTRDIMIRDERGYCWYFFESEIEPVAKDQVYFKKENDKIKKELKQIAERVVVLQKVLSENEKQIKELTSPVV